MINEPLIVCECDECQSTEEIQPEYKYKDYSGMNGYYACDDDSIIESLKIKGWDYSEGVLICDTCRENLRNV